MRIRLFILALGSLVVPLVYQPASAADPAALTATIERLRRVAVASAERVLMDQVYDKTHPEQCRFDLYLPKGAKPAPLVVYIHGGGWTYGTRLGIRSPLFQPVLERLLTAGVAVGTLDYRFANDGNTVHDCVRDVFAGLAFLCVHNPEHALDPSRIAVFGDSAGGHLCLMLSLADAAQFLPESSLRPWRIRGLVVWYGPTDFTSDASWGDERRAANFLPRLGAAQKDDPRARLLSPITHLRRDSPPILCIHGDGDTGVPLLQARVMARKAAEVGARFTLQVVGNAGHNWREAGGAIEPSKEEIQRRTAEFLIDAVRK
jgi:acetyl esterase/lipase